MEIGYKRLLWLSLIILPGPRDGVLNQPIHRERPFFKRNLRFISKVQYGPIVDEMLSGRDALILIFLVHLTPGDLTAVQSHFLFGLNGFVVKFHMPLFVLRSS